MNRYFTHCAAVLLLAASSFSAAAAVEDPTIAQITNANTQVQLATQKYDGLTVAKMTTNDFVLVSSHGNVYGRKAFLADIVDKSSVWISNQTQNIMVHPFNRDCAIAVGVLRLRYKVKGQLNDRRLRFTDVWVKQNGQWKWASSAVAPLGNITKA